MEVVEAHGADPINQLLEYVPLRKPKTKIPKDIDESKTPLQTPLLLDDILFYGLNLTLVPLLKVEDQDLENHEKFPHLGNDQLICHTIDTNMRITTLELWRWLKGVEKAWFLNLLFVSQYDAAC